MTEFKVGQKVYIKPEWFEGSWRNNPSGEPGTIRTIRAVDPSGIHDGGPCVYFEDSEHPGACDYRRYAPVPEVGQKIRLIDGTGISIPEDENGKVFTVSQVFEGPKLSFYASWSFDVRAKFEIVEEEVSVKNPKPEVGQVIKITHAGYGIDPKWEGYEFKVRQVRDQADSVGGTFYFQAVAVNGQPGSEYRPNFAFIDGANAGALEWELVPEEEPNPELEEFKKKVIDLVLEYQKDGGYCDDIWTEWVTPKLGLTKPVRRRKVTFEVELDEDYAEELRLGVSDLRTAWTRHYGGGGNPTITKVLD